jgi:tRNA (guanine37-N1)-methyltransferase
MKKFIIITSLPNIFESIFSCGVVGNALKNGLWELELVNLYDFGVGIHKKIDDTVYGGGCGMLIMADVVAKAIEFVRLSNNNIDFFYMSPRGKKFNQEMARDFVSSDRDICIICGRFEGIDQRVIDFYGINEISIGDFVLSNGELASSVVIDAVVRLLPNVMNNSDSGNEESFNLSDDCDCVRLLECDKYTKPSVWNEIEVPHVLLSGNHKKIAEWCSKNAIEVTKKRRVDLLSNHNEK